MSNNLYGCESKSGMNVMMWTMIIHLRRFGINSFPMVDDLIFFFQIHIRIPDFMDDIPQLIRLLDDVRGRLFSTGT